MSALATVQALVAYGFWLTAHELRHMTRDPDVLLRYGFHPSPFGECLIGVTPRGLCHLVFVDSLAREDALGRLARDWPQAELVPDAEATRAFAAMTSAPHERPPLDLRGTAFQLRVWDALLTIPLGRVTTYGAIAAAIGAPRAVRAVGTAVGRNPVSFVVPCHRVIRSDGGIGGYAGGVERKRVMLEWEREVGASRETTQDSLLRTHHFGGVT